MASSYLPRRMSPRQMIRVLLLGSVIICVAIGATAKEPQKTDPNDSTFNAWLGKTKDQRIHAVGPPAGCYTLSTGEEVCEWRIQKPGSPVPEISYDHRVLFTYDNGLAVEWSYFDFPGEVPTRTSTRKSPRRTPPPITTTPPPEGKLLFTNNHDYGEISVRVEVFHTSSTEYLWRYSVTNHSFNPPSDYTPKRSLSGSPHTNGLSMLVMGLPLSVPDPVPQRLTAATPDDIKEVTAPSPEWQILCCQVHSNDLEVPGIWWTTYGKGIMPGETGTFSFKSWPRTRTNKSGIAYATWDIDIIPTGYPTGGFRDADGVELPRFTFMDLVQTVKGSDTLKAVKVSPHSSAGLFEGEAHMEATFTPNYGVSLKEAAELVCDCMTTVMGEADSDGTKSYDHFNWFQVIEKFESFGPIDEAELFEFETRDCKVRKGCNPLQTPLIDPPLGGFRYQTRWAGHEGKWDAADNFKWALDERWTEPKKNQEGKVKVGTYHEAQGNEQTMVQKFSSKFQLKFVDQPVALNQGITFLTCLAAVRQDGSGDIIEKLTLGKTGTCFRWEYAAGEKRGFITVLDLFDSGGSPLVP